MGELQLKRDNQVVHIMMPEKMDKDFYQSLTDEFNNLNQKQIVIFDFLRTQVLDKSFFPVLHQLRMNTKKNNSEIKSINVNSKLKSQLHADGLINMINLQNSEEVPVAKTFDVAFINPFVDATIEVLKIQANTEIKAGKPMIKKKDDETTFDIIGVLNLISDVFNGSIAICFSKDVFLNICQNMLGENFTEITDEIVDAAGEILNMIFGKAKAELNNKKGYNISKAIPTIIRGPGIKIKQTVGPSVILPFESGIGPFSLEIELSNSKIE